MVIVSDGEAKASEDTLVYLHELGMYDEQVGQTQWGVCVVVM